MQPEYMTKQANDDLIVITRKKLIEKLELDSSTASRYMEEFWGRTSV